MDKQFENNGFLGSKFENFEHRPKSDLWDNIQQNINTHEATGPLSPVFENYRYNPRRKVWKTIAAELFPQRKKNILYWSYSVAASLTLLIGVYFFFQNYEINRISHDTGKVIIADNQNNNANNISEENANRTITSNETSNNTTKTDNTVNSVNDNFISGNSTDNTSIPPTNTYEELTSDKEPLINRISPAKAFLRKTDIQIYALTLRKFLNLPFKQNYRANSIDLKGQLASNLSFGSFSKEDYAKLNGNSYLSTEINAQNLDNYSREEFYEQIDHKPPFVLGVIYNYKLGKRLSLSSGLNYMRLSSVATNDSFDWESKYETTKHYIGIPLNINYEFVQHRNFNLFVTAGGQYEQGLVDKNKTTEFQNDEKVDEYFSKSNINGGQAGINLGFGTNYHITKYFDIYLQTGISHYYYLSHYNIWSDRAIWPIFQTGIRFNI